MRHGCRTGTSSSPACAARGVRRARHCLFSRYQSAGAGCVAPHSAARQRHRTALRAVPRRAPALPAAGTSRLRHDGGRVDPGGTAHAGDEVRKRLRRGRHRRHRRTQGRTVRRMRCACCGAYTAQPHPRRIRERCLLRRWHVLYRVRWRPPITNHRWNCESRRITSAPVAARAGSDCDAVAAFTGVTISNEKYCKERWASCCWRSRRDVKSLPFPLSACIFLRITTGLDPAAAADGTERRGICNID